MKHVCDWRCLAVLRDRLVGHSPSPVWNSLTNTEQTAFEHQDHTEAAASLFEENRPNATKQITERVLAFFRGHFTRSQYDAWKAQATRGACPVCQRPF